MLARAILARDDHPDAGAVAGVTGPVRPSTRPDPLPSDHFGPPAPGQEWQPERSAPMRPASSARPVPASFSVGGLPAIRYSDRINMTPITFDTGVETIEVQVVLRINGTVTLASAPPGLSYEINAGWRLQADREVNGLVQGMRINNIGRDNMSIGTIWQTNLASHEMRFTPPNTVSYIGMGRLQRTLQLPGAGPAQAQIQCGFEVRVTRTPHGGPPSGPPPAPATAPATSPSRAAPSWWSRNWGRVVGVALVVVAGALVVGTMGSGAPAGAGLAEAGATMMAGGAALARTPQRDGEPPPE